MSANARACSYPPQNIPIRRMERPLLGGAHCSGYNTQKSGFSVWKLAIVSSWPALVTDYREKRTSQLLAEN